MADTENKLQIAKSILKKFITGDFVTDDEIIEAFPDLKESEDEKTRKWLVEYFTQQCKTGINLGMKYCQILDYLEKQKNAEGDFARGYDSGYANCLQSHGAEWFEKQKNCSDCPKHLEGYISGRGDAENKLLDQYGILIMPEGELHMKPRWKPSEEQTDALLYAMSRVSPATKESVILSELYERLKELKQP